MSDNVSPSIANEKVIFILEKDSGVAPYSHEFISGGDDPQLLSGFISAMNSFISNLAGSEQTHWKTEYGEDTVLLVEVGDWSVGVLAIGRETNEARSKLRRIVREFEGSFDFTQSTSERNHKLEQEFDRFVMRVIIPDRLTENSLLLKPSNYLEVMRSLQYHQEESDVMKFLDVIKSGDTLGNASKKIGMNLDETKQLASIALWVHAIQIIYVPSSNDILVLSDGSLSELLHRNNPFGISPSTIRIIGSLDGRNPLSYYLRDLKPREIRRCLMEFGNLINSGYVHRISIEKRFVLVNECILNELLRLGKTILGDDTIKESFDQAIANGIILHPWVTRIKSSEDLKARCVLNDSMSTADLDCMYDALEYLITFVTEKMQSISDFNYIKSASISANKRCNDYWGKFFQDSFL